MKRILCVFFCLLNASAITYAAESKLTVPLDYGVIHNGLMSQLYTKEGGVARVWKDGKECSFLDLSNPRLSSHSDQIRFLNEIHAQIGIKMGGKCIPALQWRGELETLQKPTLANKGLELSFPITAFHAYDTSGAPLEIGELQQLLTKAVQPKLSELKISLPDAKNDFHHHVERYIPKSHQSVLNDLIQSLHFQKVAVEEEGLKLVFGFKTPASAKRSAEAEPVLTEDELKKWQAQWLSLEMTLENSLAKPPLDRQSDDVKALLKETFEEAGVAFESGLTAEEKPDPVRSFFKESWDRLAPLLRKASTKLPAAESLRYLTLISATDLLHEVDGIGLSLGIDDWK